MADDDLTYHACGFEYPTDYAAKNAWETANRKLRKDEDPGYFSCWRLADPEGTRHYIVALTPHEKHLHKAVSILKVGASKPYKPDDDLMQRLIARRWRTGVESPRNAKGEVSQLGRYQGVGGMVIHRDGRMTPWKKGQG